MIVTDFDDSQWTIATISTVNNGTQPFSGNRQWGWIINGNGNLEFFTRAIDVANISTLLNILPGANEDCQQETFYDVAEATWSNMQEKIAAWINFFGGDANIKLPTAIRVRKELLVDLLTQTQTIDQINCE